MKFQISKTDVGADVLLLGVFTSELESGAFSLENRGQNGTLMHKAHLDEFTGSVGQTSHHVPNPERGVARIVSFGLGSRADFTLQTLRDSLTAAFKEARRVRAKVVAFELPPLDGLGLTAYQFGRAIAEYAGLVDYEINHFRTAAGGYKPVVHLEQVNVVSVASKDARALRRGLVDGRTLAENTNLARNLSNSPANICTPMYLAGVAKKLVAAGKGRVKIRLMYRRELTRRGFGAYMAVALASTNEPVFIELSYEPENPVNDEVLGFVGKSITFDTGGADLKTAPGMRTMKCDMSGGAAVLGAFATIVSYKLPVRVKAFLPATDNMVNGLMNLPGNVLTSLQGLTIEVDNTDAEGRLTLVDAIEWAKRCGVTRIIDVATLTGAMVVALGSVAAGAFGNHDEFTQLVVACGNNAGERLWQMPMFPEYAKANETPMADLKNSGGADFGAGSITAAWFIRKFVGDTPWVHLDIAGPAYLGAENGVHPKGGTGFATRTLVAVAEHFAQRSAA